MSTCAKCQKLVLTENCEKCNYDFCAKCKETEGHTGVFTCDNCKITLCNTYSYPDNICWFCRVRGSLDELTKALPHTHRMIREFVNDSVKTLSDTYFPNK